MATTSTPSTPKPETPQPTAAPIVSGGRVQPGDPLITRPASPKGGTVTMRQSAWNQYFDNMNRPRDGGEFYPSGYTRDFQPTPSSRDVQKARIETAIANEQAYNRWKRDNFDLERLGEDAIVRERWQGGGSIPESRVTRLPDGGIVAKAPAIRPLPTYDWTNQDGKASGTPKGWGEQPVAWANYPWNQMSMERQLTPVIDRPVIQMPNSAWQYFENEKQKRNESSMPPVSSSGFSSQPYGSGVVGAGNSFTSLSSDDLLTARNYLQDILRNTLDKRLNPGEKQTKYL